MERSLLLFRILCAFTCLGVIVASPITTVNEEGQASQEDDPAIMDYADETNLDEDAEYAAALEQSQKECTVMLKETSGQIVFPPTENVYPSEAKCAWYLDLPKSAQIKVTLTDSAQSTLYFGDDFLEVWSLGQGGVKNLAKYAVGQMNDEFVVGGPILFKLANGFNMATADFKIQYETVTDPSVIAGLKTLQPEPNQCSEIITEYPVTILNPNYPHNIPVNTSCLWIFEAKPNEKLTLHFNEFQLYDSTNDYLELWTKDSAKLNFVKAYSEMESPLYTSLKFTDQTVLMHFYTDRSYEYGKFSLTVTKDIQTGSIAGPVPEAVGADQPEDGPKGTVGGASTLSDGVKTSDPVLTSKTETEPVGDVPEVASDAHAKKINKIRNSALFMNPLSLLGAAGITGSAVDGVGGGDDDADDDDAVDNGDKTNDGDDDDDGMGEKTIDGAISKSLADTAKAITHPVSLVKGLTE